MMALTCFIKRHRITRHKYERALVVKAIQPTKIMVDYLEQTITQRKGKGRGPLASIPKQTNWACKHSGCLHRRQDHGGTNVQPR